MLSKFLHRIIILVCMLLVNACGASATSTPAPTLTSQPALTPTALDTNSYRILNDQSIINYEATLTLGGLKIAGTFAVQGKQIRLIPSQSGFTLDVDLQIDGNSVTGANGLVVSALKNNLETDRFPYGHFLATSPDGLSMGPTPVQTLLTGTLELHGQTRPLQMPISVSLVDGILKASGSTSLDLLDYKVNVPTAVMKSQITFNAVITAQKVSVP